jgi:hypothetical protein
MSRRFDSLEHLAAYRRHGAFPAIHDSLYELVSRYARERRFLDLCCSTGLLGQRLLGTGVADFALGVDGDRLAVQNAIDHGVTMPVRHLALAADTLPLLGRLIEENSIRAVVARRCLPELLGDRPELDGAFTDTLADSGITQLFVEGRIMSRLWTNRLKSIEEEIAVLKPRFRAIVRSNRCCYLARL